MDSPDLFYLRTLYLALSTSVLVLLGQDVISGKTKAGNEARGVTVEALSLVGEHAVKMTW